VSNRFVNIGFGNVVDTEKVISIVNPDSAPIKRLVQRARDENMLVDATYGRRTRAVIVTTSGHIVISGIQGETIVNRFNNTK
jgi:regulator of extracellular matrix RemA (YlzA/DUF370 family)